MAHEYLSLHSPCSILAIPEESEILFPSNFLEGWGGGERNKTGIISLAWFDARDPQEITLVHSG